MGELPRVAVLDGVERDLIIIGRRVAWGGADEAGPSGSRGQYGAGEDEMAIRLVVTISATPGKGTELAQVYRTRCAEAMKEPGCEQFEVFQSVVNPDKLALLERWTDQAALDAHAKLNSTRPPLRPELRVGSGEREDYEYNRTR